MPRNTVKDLKERLDAKITELRTAHEKLSADGSGAEEREAFDAIAAECDALKADLARAKSFEDHLSEFDGGDRSGLSDEELAAMDPAKRKSDAVDPVLNPDAKGYRLGRVILARMDGKLPDGVEGEAHQELTKNRMSGSEVRGCLIPMTLQFRAMPADQMKAMARMAGLQETEIRELNITTGSAALPTILSGTLIDMLRNTAVCMRAGCTLLSGLEGTFEMPKVDGSPVFSWGGEGFAPPETSAGVGAKVTFTQKTVAARSKITRRFALQSLKSLDADNFTRQQLLIYLALAIDWGVLHGPGTANNVLGLFENPSVPVIGNGTDGGPVTFGKAVDMETSVADNNAEIGDASYVTNARVRGQAKQTLKFAAAGSATVWQDNEINGHSALMSNQIRKDYTKGSGTNLSGMAYGVWRQLMIGTWSGADLLVDPFTSADEGATNMYLHQDVDAHNLHDEAFAVQKDIDAQL